MAANKLIQQPDILNLDSLGAFMDAQNDPIPTVSEEKAVTKAEETASDTEGEEIVQNESPAVAPVDTTPQRPKVARYAEFYNDNPDENRITVVLNPEIKRALDIIRINCRQFNFGNILNAVCRTFIERNKEQIQRMQKDKGGIL